jgi:phosphate uptake regulator
MAEIGAGSCRAIAAFTRLHTEAARALAARITKSTTARGSVFRELLIYMMNDPRRHTCNVSPVGAHNLERFADRTTNIGERVIFLAKAAWSS